MESDTPRTDANDWITQVASVNLTGQDCVEEERVVDAAFARKLERELAAMRQQRDEAHGLIRKWRLNLVDVVEIGDYTDAMTAEAHIGMNDADKRAFLAATRKEGGGA